MEYTVKSRTEKGKETREKGKLKSTEMNKKQTNMETHNQVRAELYAFYLYGCLDPWKRCYII